MAHISFLSQSTPVDTNGNPYAGGLLYFYETGTTTPLDTYSNETLASANANPVVANSAGLFGAIYLKPQVYKVVLKTSAGVTVWTLSTLNGAVHYDDKGADVSSATATTLPETGSSFDITGTTTISSFVETSGALVTRRRMARPWRARSITVCITAASRWRSVARRSRRPQCRSTVTTHTSWTGGFCSLTPMILWT